MSILDWAMSQGWRIWIYGVATLVAIATFLGFFSHVWWGFSYFDYPRPQYCLVLVLAIVVGLLSRLPWHEKHWMLLWCIPLFINFYLVEPAMYSWSDRRPKQDVDRISALAQRPNQLSVLHVTLDAKNPDIRPAIAYINREKAQLVSILEVTGDSLPQLKRELADYQLIGAEPRSNSHGSAWFLLKSASESIQSLGTEVIHLPSTSDRPLLKATITHNQQTIHLLCFHSIRPQNAGSVAFQTVEFAALAQWSQTLVADRQPVIVIGDFNTPHWSTAFRGTLLPHRSSLYNSINQFGWQPTWHSALPKFLQIPIDHCLHSNAFFTRDRHIGPNIGSDHLPLFVDLRF
jgi:endonuclease/exonuclease/phosphatase (EEP) superfamily protein YafD